MASASASGSCPSSSGKASPLAVGFGRCGSSKGCTASVKRFHSASISSMVLKRPFVLSQVRDAVTSFRTTFLSSSLSKCEMALLSSESYRESITSLSKRWRLTATALAASSSSANSSASAVMRTMSASLSLTAPETVISASVSDVFSRADTFRMPSALTSNVTSIFASPFCILGKPESSNSPSKRLCCTMERSPSNTRLLTAVCPWCAVVYSFFLLVGMRVLRGMSLSITPPVVSSPRVSGAMSRRSRSEVVWSRMPPRIAPCTAAPYATASSGLMPLLGSLPLKKSLRMFCTRGMRVEPPTSTTSSISAFFKSASSKAWRTGRSVRLNKSMLSSSKRARVIVSDTSTPSASESSSMRAEWADERTRLARSHSCRSLVTATLLLERSTPCLDLIKRSRCRTIRVSKSSPPKCVSPFVEITSNMPESIVRMETSSVPPPRSNTRTVCTSVFLSSP
mmetsp:Transcript_5511/g.14386  ORF Transcript_5511/g.14386 Transcript_5511/m.14386 type:complete len:454 (-) Transcript_5511:612-1973(-)